MASSRLTDKKCQNHEGLFITAQQFSKQLPPEYLRYYFAAKLTGQVEDIDLNLMDFMARINSDLIGKYVNLASRCAGFIKKQFDLQLADQLHDETLFNFFINRASHIAKSYKTLNNNQAVRDIMGLADRANQYIDHHKPWALAKEGDRKREVQLICTQGLNLFRLLTLYLKPILPETAKQVEAFLNIPPLQWDDHQTPLLNQKIAPFKPLMQRITLEDLEALHPTSS